MVQPEPLRLLQITDTHLFAEADQQMRGCTTATTLAAVVEMAQRLPAADALLLTGDLSQDETAASYERLTALIRPLGLPAYWIPGNHDHLPTMAATFSSSPWETAKAIRRGGWQLLLLNSQWPDHTEGYLSGSELTWLEGQLQAHPDAPTLVALHHPPCPIGSAWMDALSLTHPERLLAIVDRYPQVRLVIFGHIHQEFADSRNGVTYLGCPSTCIQFEPNQVNLALDQRSPGCRWLELYPDGSFATRVIRISSPGS